MSIENLVKSLGKEFPLGDINTENIIMEAVRDLVKDEIKLHLKKKVDENPELKDELKNAIEMFIEAKLREAFAGIRLAKTGTKLGISMVPEKMVDDLTKEFTKVFEKELVQILEKTI